MKKSIQLKIVIVIVLLILLGVWLYNSRLNQSEQSTLAPINTETQNIDSDIITTSDEPNEEISLDNSNLEPLENEMTDEEKLEREEFLSDLKAEYKVAERIDNCATINLENCISLIITELIESTWEIALCDDLLSESSKQYCRQKYALQFAISKNDVGQCGVLTGEEKNNCEHQFKMTSVYTSNDVAICETFGETVERCKTDFNNYLEEAKQQP